MTSTIGILKLFILPLFLALQVSCTPSGSNSIKEPTSLKSLLKSKDIYSLKDKDLELALSESELREYVPLAIEELESELLSELASEEGHPGQGQDDHNPHHRAKRTLLLLKKKKLIIAKLLILKALFASGGQKGSSGGYGYAPSQPSHYGPPPTPEPSYGPPPQQYGPPPQPGYGHH